jgi:hypothetical protein
MQRDKTGRLMAGVGAVGFFGAAVWHTVGYPFVAGSASQVRGFVGAAIPALWLTVSIDLLALGMIIAAAALQPGPGGRVIVGLAGLSPLGLAALQVRFVGFIPPTALLLAIGLLALTAAVIGLGGPVRPTAWASEESPERESRTAT